MINSETGSEYAKVDPSEVRNSLRRQRQLPTWYGAWIWCLRHSDEEAAQIIYDFNMQSQECEYGDHDYCRSDRCSCVHHRAITLKAEAPIIKSCREVASEESEAA